MAYVFQFDGNYDMTTVVTNILAKPVVSTDFLLETTTHNGQNCWHAELLGCKEYHRNCTDNFWEAMVALGLKPIELPSPFNLWQNTPVEPDGVIKPNPPVSKRGDYIVMRAEMDLVICLSACPQDITSICGNKPRNAHFEIF